MSDNIACRYFTGTLNNPNLLDDLSNEIDYYQDLIPLELCPYIDEIYAQVERGSTLHLQWCCSFKEPHKLNYDKLKELLPRAHIEACKNWYASVKYCNKIDSTVLTHIGKYYFKSNINHIISNDFPESIYFYPQDYKGEKSTYSNNDQIFVSGHTIKHNFQYHWYYA